MGKDALIEFVEPYYKDKDIMHDMWHISLVEKMVHRIVRNGRYLVDEECLTLATYFHGFIYREESAIREWMSGQNYSQEMVEKTIRVAWESQRKEIPATLEGKILHDAHVLEGGKTYLVVKTLITGSVRGQTLKETMQYMEQNVLDQNRCYLPETIPLCDEMNAFAKMFYYELANGVE